MKHPLKVVLGWNLPDWLLTAGPVAFVLFTGVAAIAVRPHTNVAPAGFLIGLAVSAAILLVRHRAPLVVLAVVLGVALAVGYAPIGTLPVLLAVFTVAEYEDRWKVLVAAIAAAVVLTLGPAAHEGGLGSAPHVLSQFVSVGLAVAVGLYLRARADHITGLHERAERLERERELLAQQAVADERVRIARELHDVVAHNVSLMVVQAQALAATAQDADRDGLHRIATTGREALGEMHRMLGLLRIHDSGASEREPQPGVRDLEALVVRAKETGLDATLTINGEPSELPPGVDLSAFRIVQEALTNVIRHASAEHADVTLSYSGEQLELSVVDDGVGTAAGSNGASDGHGLVGMRERVALFGGRFEAGPIGDGHGYRVSALLPLN